MSEKTTAELIRELAVDAVAKMQRARTLYETEISNLNAQIAASEAARGKLYKALRAHVICHWLHRGQPAKEGECIQCSNRWPMPGEEKHKPDCLAAPAKEPEA